MSTNVSMPANLTLSILVPAYNAHRFIQPCLASIAGQMTPMHELVVVDDGSQDGTATLAERLREMHPWLRWRVVRQANHGIAGARNRALLESSGQYVLFVDADDLLLPGALTSLDHAIARHHPDVIACDFHAWRPDKAHKSRQVALGYPPDALLEDREAVLRTFFADRHMYVWANVFRRDIYARLPQPVFPEGRVFEDVSVLSGALAECRNLYHLARPVIGYRQHAGSLKRAVSAKWCVDFAHALRHVKNFFAERGASDSVSMHIDVTACHFYIGIVKNSYGLPWRTGHEARARVRELFLESLFHHPLEVLSAMERGAILSRDRRADATAALQVRKALSGNLAFALAKAASRRIKLWQQMRA